MAEETPSSVSAGIRYAVDEQPPQLLAAGLGIQVVVLIVAGIVLGPIIVLRSVPGSEECGLVHSEPPV